jgi:hypothetical protein
MTFRFKVQRGGCNESEWPDAVLPVTPAHHDTLSINPGKGETSKEITMKPRYPISHVAAAFLGAALAFCQLCLPTAEAIIAGQNWDIPMDVPGVDANDFHIEGRIISGDPNGGWSDPPILVNHFDGNFPNINWSIVPDTSVSAQNEYLFRADWNGATYQLGEMLHLGLMFDLTCHNLMLDIYGWWSKDGNPVGYPLLPGYEVRDDFENPSNQKLTVDNNTPKNAQVVDLKVTKLTPAQVTDIFGDIENMLPEMLPGGLLDPLNPSSPFPWSEGHIIEQGGIPEPVNELNPIDFPADSFFDVFFDIEVPETGTVTVLPPIPMSPGEVVVGAQLVRYFNDAGEETFHWTWEIHEGHGLDFGDAPDLNYQTLLASNGARHTAIGVLLGRLRDTELDGQPTGLADGDDVLDLNDDEDGVIFQNAFAPGAMVNTQITIAGNGFLSAWADWDLNGKFDGYEQIITDMPVGPGSFTTPITVPGIATPGSQTYLRFRVSSIQGLPPMGPAPDGEVEDYMAFIDEPQPEDLDFGDAPDNSSTQNYQTLLSNDGARHVAQGVVLGRLRDTEPDGQPTSLADGDDFLGGSDDEDGVVFLNAFVPGQPVNLNVTLNGAGVLNAWADWNADGKWDSSEQVFTNLGLLTGTTPLAINVPASALPGSSIYLRFRISTLPGLKWFGLAPDGEVEDYLQIIADPQVEDLDYGDAPDFAGGAGFQTLLASNGARHVAIGPQLGQLRDSEGDGQPTPLADGDDFLDGNDDDDGVVFPGSFFPGSAPNLLVNVTGGGGFLSAWADWNGNGSWDPSEQFLTDFTVVPGINSISIMIPTYCAPGTNVYLRFRLSTFQGLSWFGPALNGEVEDYLVVAGDPQLELLDWGDAPDFFGGPAYETVALNNGARHLLGSGLFLGNTADPEADGQPTVRADGDDNDGNSDDDGVTFNYRLVAGSDCEIAVLASQPGFLDAWIDFDRDGAWDPSDQILVSFPLAPGPNVIAFPVPDSAKIARTYARFRVSTVGGLPPGGFAPDGEVEDYFVPVYRPVSASLTPDAAKKPVISWNLHPDAATYGIYQSPLLGKFPHTWTLGPTGIGALPWTDTAFSIRQFYIVIGEP